MKLYYAWGDFVKKNLIVVGAGISGLTAAIYAQRSGFNVTLIEQHSIVGGMCTSWRRKGYLFEGAMHWLTGSSPKTAVHQIWRDTGAISDDVNISLHDPFYSVEHEGKILHLHRNIEKTAEGLIAISPQDAPQIRQLMKDVKNLSKMEMPIFDVKGVKSKNPKKMSIGFLLKMLPVLPAMSRLGKISAAEFVSRFSHEGIQRLLRVVPNEYKASALIFTLATLHSGDGGFPKGGSLPFVARMSKTFTDLGGNLLLNTQVEKVNIENSAATGVTLKNETLKADAVIITQETIAALNHLFETPPTDAWIQELKSTAKHTVCTFVSIGVRAKLEIPAWKLDSPITYAGETVHELGFYCHSGKEYAPEGCTALTAAFLSDTYDFWKKAKDDGRYKEEKEKLAEQIIDALCEKHPQAEGNIEVVDVATPLTYERYTGAERGAWMTDLLPGDKMKQYPGTVKDVEGLYFAGHRLNPPGGLPSAAASGRTAAQLVCRQFGVEFK
ncbi:MAG: NAD(P)/FAD-dependent oxidoreductase [Defluviitaleaceae bacterium]|nr:NAD(P)/FAD-dependent oxidoreductase [Defluviitaleaceae bacterium]